MKSYIVFIRHGITEGIQKKWFYGWTDLPVVEEGFRMIEQYKAQGLYPQVPDDAKYYTTGFLRTRQTLKAIYGEQPNTEIPNLKEVNFGDWECYAADELTKKKGWDDWMNDTTGTFRFPGGDSMPDFVERIKKGDQELYGYHRMQELAHRHSGRDAVSVMICHGGTISATMMNWFPDDRASFWDWTPTAGLGYIVYFEDGEPASYVELKEEKEKKADLT